jgi:hypothetical protein
MIMNLIQSLSLLIVYFFKYLWKSAFVDVRVECFTRQYSHIKPEILYARYTDNIRHRVETTSRTGIDRFLEFETTMLSTIFSWSASADDFHFLLMY